jgi:hypothetical protein
MTNEALTCPLRHCIAFDWYKFPSDHRCPHDAWVESITISESSSGDRQQNRGLEIHVRLLGAYHDGVIELTYKGVQSYSILARGDRAGHGDWLKDEIELRPQDNLHHKVTLAHGSFEIEAEYGEYKWTPLTSPGKGT